MKQHSPSFVGRTTARLSQLWKRRRDLDRRRAARKAFRFEALESRHLMASDPTLAALPNIVLNGGSPQWVALDGFDADGGTLTFTATSSNPLVTTNIPTGNSTVKMSVAGFGDMYFQLFEHLVPRVTGRIKQLVELGFYDDTATNTITFHRILNDFVIQAGDPTGTGSGGSPLPDFDDQFHVDLQHNRSGLLSMAKTSDDTNDSQFFITEERNESQFITLTGSPTGGTFTLNYFGQTTPAIAFNNSGDFTAIAASIKTALEGLSRIGTGNVVVTHDPERNPQTNQITENRRWRVDFVSALGHQEVVNLTATDNLTGGSNPAVNIREQKSARHLDFNHSIFGILTQGESVRDAISNVTTNSSGTPTNPPIISNVDVIVDPENGALLLKAPEGASGETDITVRVTDAQGNFTERTFHVLVTPDGMNGAPFLGEINPVSATPGQQVLIPLTFTDVENHAPIFAAAKPQGNTVNYTITNVNAQGEINDGSSVVKITPPAGFVGSFNVLVGVKGGTATDTGEFDTQVVTVTVAAAAPSAIDLLVASDTGFSNSDNITNASSLQFTITGVTSGAVVKLKKDGQVLAEGTASGTSINLTIANSATLGEGTHSLQATQTVNNQESNVSTPLSVTIDTTPPGEFTSTPPTEATVAQHLSYDAAAPGEGATGFVYSLTSAPVGVIINSTTGQLNWTPADNQAGNHVFQIVATDAAGNARQQTLNITVDEALPAKIDVTLSVTRPDGTAITSLDTNQDFVLHMFVEDFRNEFQHIRLDGNPAGGTFTLTFKTQTTAPIAFDNSGDFGAMAASIRTALEALSQIGVGNVIVTHDPQRNSANEITENRQWKVEFIGALAHQEVTNLTGNGSGLTGGSSHAVTVIEGALPAGVAQVYVDILFDPAMAEVIGPITYSSNYQLFKSGSTATPGLIDELGAFGPISGPIGPGKFELASIPMRAKKAGLLSFSSNPTDDPSGHPAGVYLQNEAVPFQETRFGTSSITVNQAALTFQAVNDTANVNEDSQNQTLNPLANDTSNSGSGNVLTIQAVGATSNGGTVQITQNGTRLGYTPAANFTGTETFTYTIQNQNNQTSTATFSVQVLPQNDPPVAVNDTASAAAGQPVVVNVLANDTVGLDTNENVQNYTVTAVTQPAQGGTVAITPGGKSVTFTRAAGQTGNLTFTYTISDGNGGTATATVTINNDNPNAVNDTPTVAEDSTGNVLNVLTNDTPGTGPNAGTNLTVTLVGATSNGGTVSVGQNGANVVYTPAANFQGTETFTYTISDGNNHTATATVTVTVTNSNDPPTATNDTLIAFKNTPAVLDVLANDAFAPDPAETLTIDSVSQPSHGTVAITNNGTRITYTPTTDYTGPDSFTYIIKDASGAASQSATVNLTVQAFIPSSLAGFVYFDVDNDGVKDAGEAAMSGVTITLTGTDANSAPVNRTLKTAADGSYKFDLLLPGNYTVSQTQPAFVIDGKETAGSTGGTTTQNDKIAFTSLAQNSNVTGNNFGERGRKAEHISLRDFFASSSRNYVAAALDNTGAALWQSVKGDPFDGFTNPVVSRVNNQIKVEGIATGGATPVSASLPLDDLRVRMLDNSSTSDFVLVSSFNLSNPTNNTPPTAVNDTFTTNEDTPLNVAVANGVLKNDTDPNSSQTLTATVVTQPAHGTLTLNSNGSFLYTPTANYNGPDSFAYRVSDGIAQSSPATVNITVTAVNDAPVAVANSYNATQNTPLNVNQTNGVVTNDTDAEGSTLTATVVTAPQHGTLTLNSNGSFDYTPTTGYTGPDSFTYRVSDGSLPSTPATVSLTVAAAGGGEGEAEGEGSGGSQSAAAAALLAFLSSQDDDDAPTSLLGGSDDWAAAVDEALA